MISGIKKNAADEQNKKAGGKPFKKLLAFSDGFLIVETEHLVHYDLFTGGFKVFVGNGD